jgi:voltage-gated potassium channel
MSFILRNRRSLRRKVRATIRDSLILVTQFKWPLLLFLLLIILGGLTYQQLNKLSGETTSYVEAVYHILGLVFLQPALEFPDTWYLQIYYFIMPILGLSLVAQGITEFGTLFFNRKFRSKEWEMAVASTLNNHIVLIGLGHLGYRIIQYLASMDQDIAVIELDPDLEQVQLIQQAGIPVIQGDGLRDSILRAAGIEKAKAIILCMQEESVNLQISLKARSMNPTIEVIVRIFNDEFAAALEKQFGFKALSATSMAAPIFAAAAAGIDMTRPITLDGTPLSLARLILTNTGSITNKTVGEIEKNYNVSVVLVRREGQSMFHPAADLMLLSGDTLAVLGNPPEINHLSQNNR